MNDLPPWPESLTLTDDVVDWQAGMIAALRARNALLVNLAESLLVEPDDFCGHRDCHYCDRYVQAQELIEACKKPT